MTNNAVDPIVATSFEESTQQAQRPKAAKVRPVKKNKHWKKILPAVIFLILILIIVLLVRTFKSSSTKCQIESSVCTTKECTLSAATLLKTVHRDENPCEDFYSFVCGKEEASTTNVFHTLHIQLINKLKHLLTKSHLESEPKSIGKAKKFYQACMDKGKIKKLGIKPLKRLLQQITPGWPWMSAKIEVNDEDNPPNDVPSKENEDIGSGDIKAEEIMNKPSVRMLMPLESLLGRLDQLGLSSTKLFDVGVINDFNDWRITRMSVDQYNPMEEVNRRKRKRTEESDVNFIIKFESLIQLITNENSDDISPQFQQMFELKQRLDMMNMLNENKKNFTERNNKMTIKELTEITKNKFNWLDYFNSIFEEILPIKLSENEIIIVQDKNFFEELLPIIFQTFDHKTIANYAVWNALINPLLKHIYAPNMTEFQDDLRWLILCIPTISDVLPFSIGRLFIDTYTKDSILNSSNKFIELLRESYKEIISRSKWLDQTTKQNAIRKLDKMTQLVGYPNWIKDDQKLDDYYEDVEIKNDYVANIISAQIANTKRKLIKFGQNATKLWIDEAGVVNVNAFYDSSTNSIIFPIGIIQIPFYEDNRLAAMNFGGVGSVIGHEIGHAFDNVGSQFDENGELTSLWSEETKRIYEAKIQCYVDQYNEYCFQGSPEGTNETCVDGSRTVGENTPDNIGLQASFNAYNKWTRIHNKEKRLPGFDDFTPEQIFFTSFAYIWCDNTNAKKWFNLHKYDSHSPGRYRVQGALSNFEEFAKAFKCDKKGSMNRMNERCTLW